MSRTIVVCIALVAGCGGGGGPEGGPETSGNPLLMFSLRDMETTAEIPWEIAQGHGRISMASMLREGEETEGYPRILREAMDNGMLIALVSDTVPRQTLGGDDMVIWTDQAGRVRTVPEELLGQLPDTVVLDSVKNHQLILDLLNVYKPDLVMIDMGVRNTSLAIELARFWISPDVLARYRVVIYSLSSGPGVRGWCLFAGDNISGVTPYGVTEANLFTTLRLMAGLDWQADLPGSVPVISVLEDPSDIWGDAR